MADTGSEFSPAGEVAEGGKRKPGRRAIYERPLETYETTFATKNRALKRWIAIGRDATPPELPPLDDPPRMKGWWLRHMKHRVPEKITQLAKSSPLGAALAAAAPSPSPPAPLSVGPLFDAVPPAAAAPPGAASALPSPVGFSGALQRCRTAEASAGELYTRLLREAAAERDADRRATLTAEAEQARRAWDELVDRLRAMERDAEKILSASGRVWLADDVLASLEVAHLALREGLRGLLRRIRPRLAALPPAEHDAAWHAEVEALFAGLRASKFTAPPADSPPAVAA